MKQAVLEPALLAIDVSGDELFVGLGQVDDAFNQADKATNTGKIEANLDNSFLGIA